MNKREKTALSRLFSFQVTFRIVLAFPVLDKLVKAVPSVIVLMHLKIVVEGLVNGFDARFDSIVARWEKV